MSFIYALAHPETLEVRYIGKANRPQARLKGHLREARRFTPLYRWMRKLAAQGLAPKLLILEDCGDNWREAERRLIAEARHRGERLLNVAEGGDEPACPPHIRQRNGRALVARLQADPRLKRIQEVNRAIRNGLRQGFISNHARAKLRLAAAMDPAAFGQWAHIPDRYEAEV